MKTKSSSPVLHLTNFVSIKLIFVERTVQVSLRRLRDRDRGRNLDVGRTSNMPNKIVSDSGKVGASVGVGSEVFGRGEIQKLRVACEAAWFRHCIPGRECEQEESAFSGHLWV